MNEVPDLMSNSTSLVEDLHSYADDEASPEQDDVDSESEKLSAETMLHSKADEPTIFL